jgi:hypothetical protein
MKLWTMQQLIHERHPGRPYYMTQDQDKLFEPRNAKPGEEYEVTEGFVVYFVCEDGKRAEIGMAEFSIVGGLYVVEEIGSELKIVVGSDAATFELYTRIEHI